MPAGVFTGDECLSGVSPIQGAELCSVVELMYSYEHLYACTGDKKWAERDNFVGQIKAVRNNPSIIVYEGSNEYHAKDLAVIDRMYDQFVDAVESVDKSRLISPSSEIYYAAMGCKYYNDTGELDEKGNMVASGLGWVNERVIRSSHTYSLLCGYGTSWEVMRKQDKKYTKELLSSKRHSYWITEFAVTGLANPTTREAQENEYVESYEREDELGPMGRWFEQSERKESQAYQALCAFNAVKQMRILGADCMAWCCLMSGANNGSYLKPPIDFYGYKKLAYYTLKDAYNDVLACKGDIAVSYGTEDEICPLILGDGSNATYHLTVSVINDRGEEVDRIEYPSVQTKGLTKVSLKAFRPKWQQKGYYTLQFVLEG